MHYILLIVRQGMFQKEDLCNISAQIDVIAFLHSIYYQLTILAARDFLDEILATFWLIF